jgi:hypothetical protein
MITFDRISSNFGESISCSRIPRRAWNLNVRGRVHKSLLQASALSLMTSSPQAISSCYRTRLNTVVLLSVLPSYFPAETAHLPKPRYAV